MEFKQLSVGEVCDRLEAYDSFKLLMHSSPDGDTFGSCMGLSHILSLMGKKCYIVYPDDKFPENLKEFATTEVYSPEQADAIGADAVVTVDVAAPNQLRENYERYKDKITMMIDHHDSGEVMADYLRVTDASAVGEIIFDIADELIRRGRIASLPIEAANALYLSITSDTGCFKYSNATPKTHRCAARLIEMGVRSAHINLACFDSKSPEQIEAEKIIYNNLRVYFDGKLVVSALDNATKAGIENQHFENAVNIARSLRGSIVSCSIKEKDSTPGSFRISMRSRPDGADVSAICAKFGGGGHTCAAGCSLDAENIDAAIEQILCAVKEVL